MPYVVLLMLLAQIQPSAEAPLRLVRSQSGPSGKVVAMKLVLDEVRNRFVFPQDKTLMVYFQWDGPVGDHVLTGLWKSPDGRTASISPDIKLQTTARDFGAYWVYEIATGMPSGIWTLEVRADGQPAGTHSFELVVPEPTAPKAPPVVEPPRPLSLDQIYGKTRQSLVWVHRLDSAGKRLDTGSGFVIGPDRVATAFQTIDSASKVEIEFEGGRRTPTEELWAFNRVQDWAIVKVSTGSVPALITGDASKVPVGERLIVYNVDPGPSRVIGGVDFGGRKTERMFGERLQLSPALAAQAAGGPLIDPQGVVVGVVGGSTKPGGRVGERALNLSPGLFRAISAVNSATPMSLVKEPPQPSAVTLDSMSQSGALTPEIWPMTAVSYGGTSATMPTSAAQAFPTDVTDFSRKDALVYVYTMWQRKDKVSKGLLAATVYDAMNRARVRMPERKFNLPELPVRAAFSFPPANLEQGTYRVDVLFNGRPVWRTFFNVVD